MEVMKTRKLGWFFGLAMMMALLFGIPQEAKSAASCANPRCHSVGEGYCLPGHWFSLRGDCDPMGCLSGQDCDYVWPGVE